MSPLLFVVHLIILLTTSSIIFHGSWPEETQGFVSKVQSRTTFMLLVILYYLINFTVLSIRSTPSNFRQTVTSENPHFQHTCAWICVKSQGRVAEIRLNVLLFFQNLVLLLWAYCFWSIYDYNTAQQFMVVNEVLIFIAWYHLLVKTRPWATALYIVNVAIFVFFGIYTNHIMNMNSTSG